MLKRVQGVEGSERQGSRGQGAEGPRGRKQGSRVQGAEGPRVEGKIKMSYQISGKGVRVTPDLLSSKGKSGWSSVASSLSLS